MFYLHGIHNFLMYSRKKKLSRLSWSNKTTQQQKKTHKNSKITRQFPPRNEVIISTKSLDINY